MSFEANREEANRAASIAREHLDRGDVSAALKFFEISHRLCPSRELQEHIIRLREQRTNSQPPESISPWQQVHATIKSFIHQVLEMENKYIAPHMKIYIRSMACVIVYLIIWRVFLRNKSSQSWAFGSLPGDISFSSNNFSFSSPIISMLILNVVANGLMQAFRRN